MNSFNFVVRLKGKRVNFSEVVFGTHKCTKRNMENRDLFTSCYELSFRDLISLNTSLRRVRRLPPWRTKKLARAGRLLVQFLDFKKLVKRKFLATSWNLAISWNQEIKGVAKIPDLSFLCNTAYFFMCDCSFSCILLRKKVNQALMVPSLFFKSSELREREYVLFFRSINYEAGSQKYGKKLALCPFFVFLPNTPNFFQLFLAV